MALRLRRIIRYRDDVLSPYQCAILSCGHEKWLHPLRWFIPFAPPVTRCWECEDERG